MHKALPSSLGPRLHVTLAMGGGEGTRTHSLPRGLALSPGLKVLSMVPNPSAPPSRPVPRSHLL